LTANAANSGGIACLISQKNVQVSNCWNAGSVRNEVMYSGGIVGQINATGSRISHCLNTGTISAANIAGGIVGNTTQMATFEYVVSAGSTISDSGNGRGAIIGTATSNSSATKHSYTHVYHVGEVLNANTYPNDVGKHDVGNSASDVVPKLTETNINTLVNTQKWYYDSGMDYPIPVCFK
jgi:hypothetical protein